MLAPPTISIPLPSRNLSETGSLSGHDFSAPPKFPHTRAQLASLARQYKVPDVFEGDPDGDDPRVDSALVGRVVMLLGNEREDELKSLLKDTFGPIDEEDVSEISSTLWSLARGSCSIHTTFFYVRCSTEIGGARTSVCWGFCASDRHR